MNMSLNFDDYKSILHIHNHISQARNDSYIERLRMRWRLSVAAPELVIVLL
jgi:hypothetical protein